MILIGIFLRGVKVLCVFAPLSFLSCLQYPLLNSLLYTSINYYTGEAGVVDDLIARQHLEIAILERDTLALMWLARVYSTGRMSFPKDSKRASSIARLVIDDVAKRAETGEPEALFLSLILSYLDSAEPKPAVLDQDFLILYRASYKGINFTATNARGNKNLLTFSPKIILKFFQCCGER